MTEATESQEVEPVEAAEMDHADSTTEVDVNSKSYIDQLKKENAKWRTRAKENKEYEAKYQESQKRIQDAETKAELAMKQIAEIKSNSEKRMIDAELRALATEYGLKKMEYLKLADRSSVKISDGGDVVGAREMIESLKQSEPELFKLPTTTNINYSIKNGTIEKAKERKVMSLSGKDYENEERAFLRSLRS